MKTDVASITFNITYRGSDHEIVTHSNEYTNLMSLLYDKFYFENFGDCKGIGRCGTCHVQIQNGKSTLLTRARNEETTLGKMENAVQNSRLSCQILIDEQIQDAHFIVCDEGDLGLY
jgi:ferredoxin, 2Fe-2S